MAIVDIPTGRIIGCKKRTLAYYHELAHLEYSKSEKGIKNDYLQSNLQDFAITFLFLSLFFLIFNTKAFIIFLSLGALSWFSYLGLETYEEIWCWIQAIKILKGGKQDGRKKTNRRTT